VYVYDICFSFLIYPRANDVYQSVYIKSHTRASPYFVGIALGYLLYNHLDAKQKIGVVSIRYVVLILLH
jgi:hypothetical protein